MSNIMRSQEEMQQLARSSKALPHTPPGKPKRTAAAHAVFAALMLAIGLGLLIAVLYRGIDFVPSQGGDDAQPAMASKELVEAQSTRFDTIYQALPRNSLTFNYLSALDRCTDTLAKPPVITCAQHEIKASFHVEPTKSDLQTGDELHHFLTANGWQLSSYQVEPEHSHKSIPRNSVGDSEPKLRSAKLRFTFTDEYGLVCARIIMYQLKEESVGRWYGSIFECDGDAAPPEGLLI